MQVVKRNGQLEAVQFDKITDRLRRLCDREPALSAVDVPRIAQHACAAVHDLILTETLDHVTADAAVALATEHPDYSTLAARVLVSNLHKTTSAGVRRVYERIRHTISDDVWDVLDARANDFDAMLDFSRDYAFDYFGLKTLFKAYLLAGERPQHMFLRVAVGLWGDDLVRVKETYDALSMHTFTHASPTLFNAGTKRPQLASCFLQGIHVDSLDGIFRAFHTAATISKFGGGIGFHVSSVRAKGSLIHSTQGRSDGLVPMLKVLNEVANYVNQCFVPDTKVYTIDGMKRIDAMRPGDAVLTKEGEYRRVEEVFVRRVVHEPMVTLTPEYGQPITCTRVHNILVQDKGFVPADSIRVGDCLAFPVAHGITYTPVVEVAVSVYSGEVYDLHVEEDHTYTTQGGIVHNSGKRKGSVAVYIEPHHADIMQVLDLKRNQGDDHLRARDLFYALWIPDLFMRRVEEDAMWSLFDPGTAPGLEDVYGEAYDELYARYEAEGRAVRQVPAHDVWFAILRSQIETGVPFMLYKDAANRKSNQQHLGTIKCSNLCSEIIEYTADDEIAVCTLGSISLPAFCTDSGTYDYEALHATTKVLVRNLDRIVDVTYYPVPEAQRSNARHRPLGVGVQGLADTFFRLKLPFDSSEAAEINRKIFATIYHAAIETSCDLCDERRARGEMPAWHPSFPESPASRGMLQFDLWGKEPHPMYEWDLLRQRAAQGMRNSLLIAPMPTASTAQILGNVEAFEPITSNLYSRTTLAGTFTIVNKYLLRDLIERGLWTPAMKNQLLSSDGSVQHIPGIPDDLKQLYKTAYDMSMRTVIDMAAERGIYVDQSMSLNMFVSDPTFRKLSSMHFYAWKKGLKTGMYYLRSQAASTATKITVAADCLMCSG